MPRKNTVVVLAPALLLFVASGKASAQQSPSICGALTAGEGAGIVSLVDVGIKAGFGRLRPSQTGSHTADRHLSQVM